MPNKDKKHNIYKIEYAKDKIFGKDKIVNRLISKYHIFCIHDRISEPYIYNNGYFVSGNITLNREIEAMLEEEYTNHVAREIISRIMARTTIDRSELDPHLNLINLKNGVYNLTTRSLEAHKPAYRLINQTPIEYNPTAKCPQIEAFIDSLFTEEDATIIYEFLGYSLYRSHPIKKALILEGERHMGKTQVCNLFINFLQQENISSVLLQDLADNRYAPASLFGKAINIADDLPNKSIKSTGIIKILTGDGTIRIEKKFKNGFEWRNTCKLMFTCNQMPDSSNLDDIAYFSRWIIIKMCKPPQHKVLDIAKTISTPEELSGLLNKALEALHTILTNKEFTYPYTDEEVKDIMCSKSSTIASFASEGLEEAREEFMDKDEMYEYYRQYCTDNNVTAEGKAMLGRKLPQYAGYILDRGKHLGVYKKVWVHVRKKELPPPPEDNDDWSKLAKPPEQTNLDQQMMDLLNNK